MNNATHYLTILAPAIAAMILMVTVILAPSAMRTLGLIPRRVTSTTPVAAVPAPAGLTPGLLPGPTPATPATPATTATPTAAPIADPTSAISGERTRGGDADGESVILPMSSSGISVLPNASVQITSRPQNIAFRPGQIVIGGTPGDWLINDIKIGSQSQLPRPGDVPGEVFASTAIDDFISFGTVRVGQDFILLATYVGPRKEGAPFVCSVLGTAVADEAESADASARPSTTTTRQTTPTDADVGRYFLPLSSGDVIPPNTSKRIVGSPQVVGFRPERILIGGTPGDWVINDITIGGRSQLAQSGDLPGAMFASTALDVHVELDTACVGMEFAMIVTYVGGAASGAPFVCGVLGATSRTRDDVRRVPLPMSSGVNLLPNESARITSRPQNAAFRPERIVIDGAPGDWIINDIKVGNRSQLAQDGDLPGEMFSPESTLGFYRLETVQTAMDFVVVATYVGDSPTGKPFLCGVIGTAAA